MPEKSPDPGSFFADNGGNARPQGDPEETMKPLAAPEDDLPPDGGVTRDRLRGLHAGAADVGALA